MLPIKTSVSCFTLLNVFIQIKALVELPIAKDNNIAAAETAIRSTVEKLFTIFRITQEVNHKPRLKQYSKIHNFFVSITLTDCNNLKEIARLSRINNIDNNTQHFITQINEVLNEDDKSNETNDTNNTNVSKYSSIFVRKLKYLKEVYQENRNTVINADILKYSGDDEPATNFSKLNNTTHVYDSDQSEFWRADNRRIYQGIRTTIKKFPFMASILFFKKFQCAGSIIKNDLVITSASCLQLAWNNRYFRENPTFLSVQIGSEMYEGGGENIDVIEIYFYPQYEPKTLRNNLALLRLTRKINFKKTNKRVKKINIDRNSWPLSSQTPHIIVVGWGAKDDSNVISNVFTNKLSHAELDYYSLVECQDLYSKDFVTDKNFCAGFLSKGGGACNRDAGGPGIVDNTLFGVISFGSPHCGAPDAPTVFTKLGFYADWIETIMQESAPSIYSVTTTQTPNTMSMLDFQKKRDTTVKRYLITGVTTRSPALKSEVDFLRIAQDKGLKDFLATMFSNDEISEYFDKSSIKTNKEINYSQASGMSDKQILKSKLKESIKTEAIKIKSIHRHKPKLTTPYMNLVDSSDESNSNIDEDIETTTISKRKVAASAHVSDEDKNLEDDIKTLIDQLDLDEMLKPTEKSELKVKDSAKSSEKLKEKEKKPLEIDLSGSEENRIYINPNQKSVLKYLFLSKEDKDKQVDDDDDGSNKSSNNFKDSSLRDTQQPNNTKKHDMLTEQSIFDMISLAIEEETKPQSKGLRYTL